ncbi:type II toxin-antitoxin system HicA family toxin [Crocosphaera sp.]|uniref:type II toxin-antitoxin system HicA family toxin n=1 Tax=Crocosphaera sp. TaxID=2729996 RepID=UPI003F28AF57|nr:type II toxin-antitoxin system HicA family toxin [Crocosphaera sp.]
MIFPILRKQLSYGQVAVIVGRLVIIELLLLAFGILAVRQTYYTYHAHSIPSSQSLNTDSLFPTVPLALSYAIRNSNTEQVNQILTSNYQGLQGLIITDLEGKEITHYSHQNSRNRSDWLKNISSETLNSYPHHLLVDPFSSIAKSYYADKKTGKDFAQTLIDKKLILARVYYIQDFSDSFSQELLQWLENPFQNNTRFPIYNLTLLSFIIGGLFIWSFSECFLSYRLLTLKENEQLSQRLSWEKKLLKQEILILEFWQEKSQDLEEITEEKNHLLLQLEEQQNLEQESKKQIQFLREKIELFTTQNKENKEKINDLQELQLSNKKSIQQREETIKREFERQINLIKLESQYAFEEAQKIEQEKEKLMLQNKALREHLNSEIEKNKYLEFVLESYKEENKVMIDESETNDNNYSSIPTSYLTNIPSRKAIKSLQKLGFQKDRHKGDHYILKKTATNTITVPIPHPRQELNPLTLKSILLQTNTSLEDFLNNL